MFWKIFERVVRLIYFRRFRRAEQIGAALKLSADGDHAASLARIDALGDALPPSVLPLWAYSRGRVLERLGRVDEAIQTFNVALQADRNHRGAQLELAVLLGRRFAFDDCRALLEDLAARADEQDRERVAELTALLDKVTSGERARELAARAEAFAAAPLPPDGEAPGLPADLRRLDRWLAHDPRDARRRLDDAALLVGQSLVAKGARWQVSLGLDDSLVVGADGRTLDPFALIDAAIEDPSAPLSERIATAWKSD